MKILLLSLIVLATSAFTRIDNSATIINALKTGNAEEVSKYFDNFIDLKLPEKDEIRNMGKNQAGIALQSFYKDNNVKGFDLTSQRDMGNTMYLTGKLTNGIKSYNITLMLKAKEGNYQIITVRIN